MLQIITLKKEESRSDVGHFATEDNEEEAMVVDGDELLEVSKMKRKK